MSMLGVFRHMAQKVRDELRGEGEWEGHPATERSEYTTRYLEGYLRGVEDCELECRKAELPQGVPVCGRCEKWVPSFFVDGAGLCRRMVGAESGRLAGCGDFATGVNWTMEHLREKDDRCSQFKERGDEE